jgi:chemotaxis protein MotB
MGFSFWGRRFLLPDTIMAKKDAHHGGAWKVAYADFVTAMMALFIVLWICKEKPGLAQAIAGSFRLPIFPRMAGGDFPTAGVDEGPTEDTITAEELPDKLDQIALDIQKLVNLENPDPVLLDVEVSGEQLKVNLYDRSEKPLFEEGSAKLTPWGDFVMEGLSWVIEKNKLSVMVDGHTATRKNVERTAEVGLWEISIQRANACRRSLIKYALDPKYTFRVSGFGDSNPLPNLAKDHPSNERITLMLTPTKAEHGKKK